MAESTIRDQATRGAILIGASQIYRIGTTFVSSVILARLLTPADFGLNAIVASCVGLITLIQDIGLAQATIQRQRLTTAQTSALFWLAFGAGLLLAIFLALSAPLVAWFFGDGRLKLLIVAFSSLIFVSGAQSQQLALLSRDLRFKTLAGIDVISASASVIAGVIFAWMTMSYWAFFVGNLAASIVGLIGVWVSYPLRTGRPSFDGEFKEIISFGSGVSGFNIANYFARNADYVLIAKFYGSTELGFYDRAYKLLLFPLQQILGPLGRIMLPMLARIQSDPDRYRRAYTESISLLMILSQPGLIMVTIFADDVFSILFGPHWAPSVPIFRWLGLCGLHQVMTSTTGWLFVSQGRSGDLFRLGVVNAVATVISVVIGLPWGALGVAMSYTGANYAVLLPITWWWAGARGPVSTVELIRTAVPHAVATATSAVVLLVAARRATGAGVGLCFGLMIASYLVYVAIMLLYPAKRAILVSYIATFARILVGGRPAELSNTAR
jgi:polysaccharide transporter, PST family